MGIAVARDAEVRRDLVLAAAAVLVAVAVGVLLSAAKLHGSFGLILAYLGTWVPLVAAVLLACRGAAARLRLDVRSAWPAASGKLGLRFGVFDLFWGVAAGCLARAFDASVNLMLYGSTGLARQPVLDGGPTLPIVVVGAVAAVLVAPVVEEVFFRGLLQRALIALAGERLPRAAAAVVGVLVTSAVFALVHLVGEAPVALLGTFVFALAAGTIAATTGRIGGAIVAHVVFNGIAVALTV